jgi:hypothetical protein
MSPSVVPQQHGLRFARWMPPELQAAITSRERTTDGRSHLRKRVLMGPS